MSSFVPDDNWLAVRTASALLDLAGTPYSVSTDTISTTPKKKAQTNNVSMRDREYLTNWPADTVFKTKWHGNPASTPPFLNKLELETTSTVEYIKAMPYDTTDVLLGFIATAQPVYLSAMWTGGNDHCYASAEFAVNEHYQEDTDLDGTPEDYWRIMKFKVTWDLNGGGGMTYTDYSDTTGNTSPEDFGAYGVAHVDNGSFPPGYDEFTIFAKFNGSIVYGQQFLDDYGDQSYSGLSAHVCARLTADSAHGLSAFVTTEASSFDQLICLTGSSGIQYNQCRVFSFREGSTAKGCSISQKADTECKWQYTPVACEDCWYAGKVVTLEVAYKQAQVTDTVSYDGSGNLKKSRSLGSWSAHSTATHTLTLPSSLSKTQLGTTFSVPTLAGYVVAIDDIRLVSVA